MERLDHLEGLGLISASHLPVDPLLEISSWVDDIVPVYTKQLGVYFRPYIAPGGTIILKEGEKNPFFCLLCDGTVNIIKEDASGKPKKLHTIGPGKAFGEISFFDHGPSSASVVVVEQATLLVMHEHEFNRLCADFPRLALEITFKLIRTMSARLRQTSGRLIDLL